MLIAYLSMHAGIQGRTCDAGVFLDSPFYNALTSVVLNVPQPSVLPGNNTPVHYMLVRVADDALPLTRCLIKPYAAQVPKKECLIIAYPEHVV
jgi:hypothetical protein